MNIKVLLVLVLMACLLVDTDGWFRRRRRRRRRWFRIRLPPFTIRYTTTFSSNKTENPQNHWMMKDTIECNKWEAIDLMDDDRFQGRDEDKTDGVLNKEGGTDAVKVPWGGGYEGKVDEEWCSAACKGCPVSGAGCPQCPVDVCRCAEDQERLVKELVMQELESELEETNAENPEVARDKEEEGDVEGDGGVEGDSMELELAPGEWEEDDGPDAEEDGEEDATQSEGGEQGEK